METEFAIKLKKGGQRYTVTELKHMGWTGELLERLPMRMNPKNNQLYYRASDVRKTLEKNPEIYEFIAKEAESRTSTQEWLKRVEKIPYAERAELAKKVAPILDDAFMAADFTSDVRCVAECWHKLFLDGLLASQSRQLSGKYSFIRGKSIMPRLDDLAAHGWKGCFTGGDWASRWRKVCRSAWTMMMPGESGVDVGEYIRILTRLAKREIQIQLVDKKVPESVAEIFSSQAVRDHYPRDGFLYDVYTAYYVPEVISRDLSKLIAVAPKDEYPAARQMTRRFEIHVGGTNTGKTYQSLQRLKAAPTGVYLAPLRLLALEVQERLLDEGVICSMLTGEEEDIREDATHISSTVEKLDIHRHYDVAVIDECQMVGDRERGFAWTRAILGVRAEEIHLCVAPEGLHILERLIKSLGESYTIVEHERKVPLRWINDPVPMKQAQQGDAFVAFSKKRVLQLADSLRRNGIPTSIIYGKLPYSTRRRQMQMFLDGETSVLVATDAIGMGLNLPIRRVIFTEGSKFDGESTRPLNASEVRQIAGRAGRFGLYDEGFAAAGPGCNIGLGAKLEEVPFDINTASLGFSELVLKIDRPLIDVLKVWNQMPAREPYMRMDISRYIFIIDHLQRVVRVKLSKEDLLRAANIPFDEDDERLLTLFGQYCRRYASGSSFLKPPVRKGTMLSDLELYHKSLDLYYSFSKNFNLSYDKEWLTREKESIAEEINELLIHDLRSRGSSCRKCGAHISLKSPYSLCERCHEEQIQQQRFWGCPGYSWY